MIPPRGCAAAAGQGERENDVQEEGQKGRTRSEAGLSTLFFLAGTHSPDFPFSDRVSFLDTSTTTGQGLQSGGGYHAEGHTECME